MRENRETILACANNFFRNKDFENAIKCYEEALDLVDEPLKKHIRFNMDLAIRHLRNASSFITLQKPDDLDDDFFNLIRQGNFFDPAWYLAQYKEQHNITGNPLAHYLAYGVELSTNPSSRFDTAYYIRMNPDVTASGMHPFLHYVSHGHPEGRCARETPSHLPPEECRYVPRLAPEASPVEKAVRVIAFYLPQFHSIPENDAWWGSGFTEWSNVLPARPQFEGHYQPHVPDAFLGYYDLQDVAVMHKQVELARQYGVEGFCFHTYWFSGRRLLETPVDNYLADPSLDLPFCICWANENWSRRWDGLDQDLLMVQDYSAEDDIAFIAHMSRYLQDPRYIRVDGKPLLIVYRPNLFPSMKETAGRWRGWCRDSGLGEIHIAYVQSFETCDPADYGLDAAIEFPPNISRPPDITEEVVPLSSDFSGRVFDWSVFPSRSERYESPEYTLFRSATPSWDNTARRKNAGIVFYNNTPKLFEKWLTNAFVDTRQRYSDQDKQLVFINAWNEWAEGAHLEPDQRYGYAWLDALRRAHRNALEVSAPELYGKTLLFVDYALPMYDRYAGSRTNYMYLLLLLKMGMKVIYLPADFLHVEPYSSELKDLGVEVLAGEWFQDHWEEWFKEHGAGIDYAFMHKPDPALQFLDAIYTHTDAAIIYQCHDLHYLRMQRQAELTNDKPLAEEAEIFREKESYLFSESDALLTFSTLEEGILRKNFPQRQVHTVPLFFYEEEPKAKSDFNKRRDLLYVGGLDHTPNKDAVLWFCREVFPLILRHDPDIVFNVVGGNPPAEITALDSANINILGRVSEEKLNALYDSIKLSVVPLRYGAGVKGKVVEALSNAVPLVATSVGLEGIEGVGQAATPKDDPLAFAAEVLSLYHDESLWKERSLACAEFVASHFTVQNTAEQLREIFAGARACAKKRCSAVKAEFGENPLRTIALHLPQYHPVPENDEWWGKGFTEWRNVCKAKPLFEGHNQPHIPADLGFYDLRQPESRAAQADLAREYGINGFCYYHYWFNGKRLLERPVEEILESGKPDFPFCLCWANENWTRRWDGEDSLVLMEQVYSEEDDRAHINDLFRFFRDPRYIRVDGKPLFLVYRTENIPDPARTAEIWREEARRAGIGELYLVRVESIGRVNPLYIGFDAAMEFAPDWNRMGPNINSYESNDPDLPEIVEVPSEVSANNHTRSYVELVDRMQEKEQPPFPWFRCVTPSWDNSARRSEGAVVLLGSSPDIYQEWLEETVHRTMLSNRPSERIVFVNAWNEWAEGNHLEPCIKWGRSYLKATRSGIENGLAKSPDAGSILHRTPQFSGEGIGEEEGQEAAASLLGRVKGESSSRSLTISFEDFADEGSFTYMKGWAAINEDITTEGTDILILVHNPEGRTRLILPAKRNRPEITTYFNNGRNYNCTGFEAKVKAVDPGASVFVIIKRDGEMFWQRYC